ncbi:aryl-alcohol dehydrogenase-like predicted oxidoreductase [Dyadobacter jejuensis]|uniref:Aryl-alcohol dehydrogenase-like predicted oxidoreductase n=1 Tax=Dyadobacter jejuensis TaxID=1082580 RepID=A0A316AJN4_9BACT|nr:aldo/keto reductase [Dyadobacter jejuensis]PWJ57184.1 aryl-alcohol dehydrogenase-like predicted oxidoreductase [Dyadobacter jejuensis]
MEYKFLGNTGVLVSELCFGTMTFGGEGYWEAIGKLQQEEGTALVKTAWEHGINFYDTANIYSYGQSEVILGKALKDLGIKRNEVVIATKARGRMSAGPNRIGLSRLHLMDSVNESLQRLDTDHIDLFYIHGVDAYTSLEETMRGLEDIVRSGKVRYLGISNHAAWQIMKANGIADKNGWTKFVACQHYYSIGGRDLERELIPMMEDQNLALMPWSPLAGGFLSGKYTRGNETNGDNRRDKFDFPPINKERAYDIVEVMEPIAQAHGVSVARVALAWVLHQKPVTSLIVGAKNPDQLIDNIAATKLKLTADDLQKLDAVSALETEYPTWMFARQGRDRLPQ